MALYIRSIHWTLPCLQQFFILAPHISANHLVHCPPYFPLPSGSHIKSFFRGISVIHFMSKIFQFPYCFQCDKYHLLWMQYHEYWWWTLRLSETCRVVYQNKVKNSASCWFLLYQYIIMHSPSIGSIYHKAQSFYCVSISQCRVLLWYQYIMMHSPQNVKFQ